MMGNIIVRNKFSNSDYNLIESNINIPNETIKKKYKTRPGKLTLKG